MRIQVTPERDPNRIEGFCEIPGWRNEQSVISLIRNRDRWIVGSSMAFPSDIEKARVIMECYNKAFETLDKIQGTSKG